MTSCITSTIACDEFDHIRALMDGTVKPQGIDLVFITELTNPERHGRMVRDLAFDVCELNMPTYLDCAGPRRPDHGDSDVSVPQVPPWQRLHQSAMRASRRRRT